MSIETIPDAQIPSKECCGCKVTKPLTEFGACRNMPDGRLKKCKACLKAMTKARGERLRALYGYTKRPLSQTKQAIRAREFAKQHPKERRAVAAVNNAVKLRRLRKPSVCKMCGRQEEKRHIQGHHEDYSKPLKVIWLCRLCHRRLHAERRKAQQKTPALAGADQVGHEAAISQGHNPRP